MTKVMLDKPKDPEEFRVQVVDDGKGVVTIFQVDSAGALSYGILSIDETGITIHSGLPRDFPLPLDSENRVRVNET